MRIELATTSEAVDRALDIAERVWGQRPISNPMIRALELAGCYVSTALDEDDRVVGMCAGFVGVHGADLHLHSHLAAVVPNAQGSGVGTALKRHQREWCLTHGIMHVSWTFDPLVVENARFNLHHLGATAVRYLVDLYGPMDDDINRGDPTDRLLVHWDLTGRRTTAALETPWPAVDGDELRARGAADAVTVGDDDAPRLHDTDAAVRLVAAPVGIVQLRRSAGDLATRWRYAVRAAMTDAFDAGLRAVAVTPDGSYVLAREERA